MQEASFLFYVLATIDFAWGAPQLLREHDFNGLFLSLIKKLLVVSFFYAPCSSPPDLDTGNRQQLRPARRNRGGRFRGAESIGHHEPGASDCLGSFHQSLIYKPPDGGQAGPSRRFSLPASCLPPTSSSRFTTLSPNSKRLS